MPDELENAAAVPVTEEKLRRLPGQLATVEMLLDSVPGFLSRLKQIREVLGLLDKSIAELLDTEFLTRREWNCLHCGHRWRGRTGIWPPTVCPSCRSESWSRAPEHPSARRPGDAPGTLAERRRAYPKKSRPRTHRRAKAPGLVPASVPIPGESEPVAPDPIAVPAGVNMPPPPPGLRERLKATKNEEHFPLGEG